jgi:hypothetical protein
MNAAAISAALAGLTAIDLEAARARDAYGKFEHVARQGPSVPHWELNSPPGHFPQADKDRLALLAHTVEVAAACQQAAAPARRLLEQLATEEVQ